MSVRRLKEMEVCDGSIELQARRRDPREDIFGGSDEGVDGGLRDTKD